MALEMWHLECCTYNCIDNIMQANPPQLHSNLLYIQRYRSQSRLVAEAAYFFTNILAAESFISNINAKAPSMDETEFESNMETAWALLSGISSDFDGQSDQSDYRFGGDISRAEPMESKHNLWMFIRIRTPQYDPNRLNQKPEVRRSHLQKIS